MIRLFQQIKRKKKYGLPIIVVSGLPRSGTSMMMKMLDAGGIEVLTDSIRSADEDNPKGYFELERVKELDKGLDKSWLIEIRGKAIKIISSLLRNLPPENCYQVIFMNRDPGEILASQNKMLVRRGEKNETSDARMRDLYEDHLKKLKFWMRMQPNFQLLEIDYKEALEHPAEIVTQLKEFLECRLNTQEMRGVIDQQLYRNRK